MTENRLEIPAGVTLLGALKPHYETILTEPALEFVAALCRSFRPRVHALLQRRQSVQARYDAGEKPDFLEHTSDVRESVWTVAPLPKDLHDRRVEITGPVDRKMIINALNSGANVFMADFEDSTAPTWQNCVQGQINLRDANQRRIDFDDPVRGKRYALNDAVATLMVRPRGWHLFEKHMLVDGEPVPAGIFDGALYLFHNAKLRLDMGSGPYFYLPKLQSHLEARLWNDIFVQAQRALDIARGTIKATVLIETLPAAFEMDEILFELREHSAGLNCGRWDYIFSFIKTLRAHQDSVLPDRSEVGMTQPCMRAYTQLVVKTCHRRNVHAMGGMAAQIPIKNDAQANQAALDKVRADKVREVQGGHDGTWVAHPALVGLAREIFDAHMPQPNQIENKRDDVQVSAADLLVVPTGSRTEAGLRQNIAIGVQYLEAWLGGLGCVPLNHLMEDAATAEISRTQIWQWLHHAAKLDDGRVVSRELFRDVLAEEMQHIKTAVGQERFDGGHFAAAQTIFEALSTASDCADFLTLAAYDYLLAQERQSNPIEV